MKGFIGVVIGGVATVAFVATILHKSGAASSVLKSATNDYSKVATNFQNV